MSRRRPNLTDEQREKHLKIHAEAAQRNGTLLLSAFNRLGLPIYAGTTRETDARESVVLARRRRNRAAAKSRRINRGR